MPRQSDRAEFTIETRAALLENDVDKVDQNIDQLKRLFRNLTWALVSVALSFTTASVFLALNLAVGKAPL